MLILIEGMDGMGKTSLVDSLYSDLLNHGYLVHKVKYPSNTIRNMLGKVLWSNTLTLLLFYIDFLWGTFVYPMNYSRGNKTFHVILDRYWVSSLCYQVGVDKPLWLRNFFIWVLNLTLPRPDVTIWLHGNLDTCINRLNLRVKHDIDLLDTHMEELNRLKKVHKSYSFFMPLIDNCYDIKAELTQDEIMLKAMNIILSI